MSSSAPAAGAAAAGMALGSIDQAKMAGGGSGTRTTQSPSDEKAAAGAAATHYDVGRPVQRPEATSTEGAFGPSTTSTSQASASNIDVDIETTQTEAEEEEEEGISSVTPLCLSPAGIQAPHAAATESAVGAVVTPRGTAEQTITPRETTEEIHAASTVAKF
jgi:hypothetical protein